MRAASIVWRDYNRFMQKYVKKFGDDRLTKVPVDLDTKPYRDEHDTDLLRRMCLLRRPSLRHFCAAWCLKSENGRWPRTAR